MPIISRWMIRCSFVYLLMGTLLGAVMLVHKAYPLHPAVWQLLPIHIEITIFGWIIQLTLGTGYWMLPRFLESPQRGKKIPAILMVLFLNLGIMFVVINSLVQTTLQLSIAGRLFELASVILFISLHWNRIVTYRSRE
ncbi:MAG TPA: cbb3-type cytochrome c oxidase subunit I [Halalkalibaculum sp.]|nr:cbb3-type cytochrome c oxidase subunit I [Halalkalibaculum sp.]